MPDVVFCALFFLDEFFASLSLWVILRFVFLKSPARSPFLYCLFGVLFAANAFLLLPVLSRHLYDYDGWADFVSVFLMIAACLALFRDGRRGSTALTVIVYDATIEMLYSLIASYLPSAPWIDHLCCALMHAAAAALIFIAAGRSKVNVLPEVFSGIPKWIWAVLLLFELTCYYKVFGEAKSWYGLLYSISSAAVILCVLYLIFRIFWLIHRQNGIIEQLNEQRLFGETLLGGEEELRSFRHDYKNHMIVVNALLSAGRTDEARSYLETISRSVDGAVKRISTGNFVADAILNNKEVALRQSGGEIVFSGHIPSEGIGDQDMCTVLANLADNAIEAIKKTDGAEKRIILNAGVSGDCFFLKMSNPTVAVNKKGTFATTKTDRRNHGIGLRNVRKAVESHGGKLITQAENGVFSAELMMEMDQGSAETQ